MMGSRNLERPEKLDQGQRYLYKEKGLSSKSVTYRTVTFLGYSPSAAQIIVGVNGAKTVISRKDLFQGITPP